MLQAVRNFVFGLPDNSGIEGQEAPKTMLNRETKLSWISDLATGLLNTTMVVGSGTHFRGKIFQSGLTALCCGVVAKSERFRLDAKVERTSENRKEALRSFIHAASFGLESVRNVLLGASTVVAFDKQFGEGLAHYIQVGVDQFYQVEGLFGKVIPTLAITSCGFSLAALQDEAYPEISRALRIMSIAHAIYGIGPDYIGPVAEKIVATNYDILGLSEFGIPLLLGVTVLSMIRADDRKKERASQSLV